MACMFSPVHMLGLIFIFPLVVNLTPFPLAEKFLLEAIPQYSLSWYQHCLSNTASVPASSAFDIKQDIIML